VSTHTALLGRVHTELSAARRGIAAMSRWQLARWLVLPGLFGWATASDVVAHPWHAGPALLTVGALLARYRWPATALLVVALISGVPAVIPALPFLAYGAGRRLASTRRAIVTFVVASAAVGVSGLLEFEDFANRLTAIALAAGYVTTVLLLPAAFGAIRGERARRIGALQDRNATLERAQRLGDLRARMRERARIAGEMHDLLGHRLSLIALYAGALELRTRDQQAEVNSQADLIRRTAGTALDELREVLGILRVDTGRLDDEAPAEGVGRRADIESLVEASRAAGQPVDLAWAGDDLTDVDVRVRRAVHRVVRESLTNVHKHAPQAPTQISVRLDHARIVVEVRNPLRTPQSTPHSTGLGLVGLQERARLVGGAVTTGRAGDEFVLTASLPLTVPDRTPGGSDHGDPHIDHDLLIDGQTRGGESVNDAELDLEASSTRSLDTMSKPVKIILTCLIGAVLLVCGGGLISGLVLAHKAKQAAISPAQYAAVKLGQTREDVKGKIGDVGSIGKLGVDKDKEPPVPAGTTCQYALSKKNTDDGPTHVYRFCYAGDKLVEKREMIFPNTSATP
jgi:signal transduction histidine kinase